MGGHDFQHYQAGANMRDAYGQAFNCTRDEYGSNGYNGTISTTCGVRQVVHQPMTRDGASLYTGTVDDNAMEKWGAALAIPVSNDDRFTFKTVKFTVELPVQKPVFDWEEKPTGQVHETTEWDLQDAGRAEAFKRFGNTVHTVTVTPKLKAKVVAESTPGTSVTSYEVAGVYGRQKLYDTKAQAVKAAGEQLLQSTGTPKLTVKAVRYWPDANTTDAVTVRKQTVSAKAEVEVTVASAVGQPAIDGWLFFGIAAS